MRFVGPLNLDNHPQGAKSGQWKYAKNVLLSNGFTATSNEEGFNLELSLEQAIIGICKINDEYVVFSTGDIDYDATATCEIGVYRNNTYTPVLRDRKLNFHLHNPIEAVFYKNFLGEIIVAWCDGINDDSNSPRICNIDNLPFSVNLNLELVNPNDIDLINIFPNFKIPYIDSVSIKDGGFLKTGSYYLSFTYELKNGDRLQFVRCDNPISIIDDSLSTSYNNVDGSEGGLSSGKSIYINVLNIDTVYDYLVVGVISNINQQKAGYIYRKLPITGSSMSFTLDDLSTAEVIDYREIIVPKGIYSGAKTITNVSNELHIANLRKKDLFGYQKYANNIKIEWLRDEQIKQNGTDSLNTYKDGSISFYLKSFSSDEVYAFYIALWFKNGEVSPLYHIPGRRAYDNITGGTQNNDPTRTGERKLMDASASGTEEDYLIGSDVYYFQTRNTARTSYSPDLTHGEMGFWENEDEKYPNVGEEGYENSAVFSGAEVQIDTIEGENLRHHRFPDYNLLTQAGEPILKSVVTDLEVSLFGADVGMIYLDDSVTNFNKRGYGTFLFSGSSPNISVSDVSSTPAGTWAPATANILNNKITFVNARRVTLKYIVDVGVTFGQNGSLNYPTGDEGGNCTFNVGIRHYDSGGGLINTILTITNLDSSSLGTGSISFFINTGILSSTFNVNAGDYLLLSITANVDHNAADLSFTIAENMSGFTGVIYDYDAAQNFIVTQPLGIKVKDIYIPQDLRDQVQGIEIFYAQRNVNNSIIIDKSLVFDYDWNSGTYDVTRGRFHPFTLLNRSLDISPSYVKKYFEVLDYTGGSANSHLLIDEDTILSQQHELSADFRLRILNNSKYLPFDNIATTPSNDDREFCYYAEMNSLPVTLLTNPRAYSWVALCNYRKNCYIGVDSQIPVSTGKFIPYTNTAVGLISDQNMYGGDTFVNLLAVSLRYPGNPTWATFYVPHESIDNISLRHELEDNSFKYYPKSSFPAIWTPPVDPNLNQYDYYNKDYSAINNLFAYLLWAMNDEISSYTNLFPYRNAYSETIADENTQLNWRNFKVDSYYEMPRDKGVIWKIQGSNKTLYISQEFTTFVASIKDKLSTSLSEIYLGTSDLFGRAPDDILSIPEGYIGCTSQFACFLSKLGYIIIDRKQGKVIALSDKINEISLADAREYFRDNLQTSAFNEEIDNPFTQIGITSGYDEKWNRLIITKNDYERTQQLIDLIDEGNTVFEDNFYKEVIQFEGAQSVHSLIINNTIWPSAPSFYLTEITINGNSFVTETPISFINYNAIRDFLASIPYYIITINPNVYDYSGIYTDNFLVKVINSFPTDVISISYSTSSLGTPLTIAPLIVTASIFSPKKYEGATTSAVPNTAVIKSIVNQSDGLGSYPIDENVQNVTAIKAKLKQVFKDNVDIDYTYDGNTCTLKIGFYTGSTYNGFYFAFDAPDNLIGTLGNISDSSFILKRTIYYEDERYFTPKKFTLSFCPDVKGWIAYHDYYPHYLFNNVNGLMSVKNKVIPITDPFNDRALIGTVYKHNIKGKYGIYYDNTIYESYVDIIFNFDDTIEKIIDSINWVSKVSNPTTGAKVPFATATHIIVYSDTQCSSKIVVISNPSSWYKHNAREINGKWHFDQFIDVVKVDGDPFIDSNGNLLDDPITGNIAVDKAWFKKNIFAGKFGIVRIIYDNSSQNLFTLFDANVITDEAPR